MAYTFVHHYDLADFLEELAYLHGEIIGTRGERRREILQEIKEIRREIVRCSYAIPL